MNDRRNGHARIPLRARVWCEDDEVTLYVPTVDVSDGGMCVRTGRTFEEGRQVRVGFSGPEGDAVATARVAWSRPSRQTPATGLQLEEFVQGREVFAKMVARARNNRARVEDPTPLSEDWIGEPIDD